jgi:signal transduction histidine kinase
MKRRFVAVIVLVVVVVLAVRDVPLGMHLARIERERRITRLERDAYVLAGRVSEAASDADGLTVTEVAQVLTAYAATSTTEAVIVDDGGALLGGTDSESAPGESYTNRPEIVTALLGGFASGRRESLTLGEGIVYAAVPVVYGDAVVGAVRLSNPESVINDQVWEQVRGLLLGAAISIVIGVIAALLLASLLTRPIVALRDAAKKLADGDPDVQVDESGPAEMKRLARTFNDMSRRVQRMLDRQRRFAGDAAHQLRTPLTALRLRLESAGESLSTNPLASREHIEAAVAETDRLAVLTEQMLQLARTEGRVLPVQRIDIDALVRTIVDEWQALAAEHDVTLTVVSAGSHDIESSEVAWREILTNYIDNAMKHSPRQAAVDVIVDTTSSGCSVTIRDRGPGLSDDERTSAFDRFWRGRDGAAYEGSGLGLAIVAQLAQSAHLHAELRVAPGGGTDAVVATA